MFPTVLTDSTKLFRNIIWVKYKNSGAGAMAEILKETFVTKYSDFEFWTPN